MRNKDLAERQTDDMIDELEKKIVKIYAQAQKEIEEKYLKYSKAFQIEDEKRKKELQENYTDENVEKYNNWRKNKLFTEKRYKEMFEVLSEDLVKADQKAMSVANGFLPEAYALNFNYETYDIEQNTQIDTSFTLYSRESVEQLVKQNEIILPKRKVDVPKDQRWNVQHLNNEITQGILQGKSIPEISKSLRNVTDMNRKASVRNARTMMTGAQNSGRMDAYARADSLGIKIEKEWMATLDSRTRDSHQRLDGERVPWKKVFSNGLMYPGDPSGDPAEVYNCRCTMVPFYPDYAEGNDRITYLVWAGKHEEIKESKPIQHSDVYNLMVENLEKIPVKYNDVTRHENLLSEEEIVSRVGGGDLTKGSCASLGFCYIGQKNGLDVLDFRGGESQNYFSRRYHMDNVFKLPGINPIVETAKSEITAGKHLLKKIEEGKQYYFCVGRHAAIVRKEGEKYQYMELQTFSNNGWTDFNGNPGYTLYNRFGCRKSNRGITERATMVDIEDFTGSEDFYSLLGYINTPEKEQKKGERGYAK